MSVPTIMDLIISGENLYEWKIENWGTYWNSLNNKAISPDSIIILTAWNPPRGIIEQLGCKFPDAQFT